MSAAGLEAIGISSPDAPRWYRQIQGMRNPDGTFGTRAAVPFATGGSAAAILRLGMPLEHRDAIVKAILDDLAGFKAMHPALSTLDASEMARRGLTAPMHPGAAYSFQFYQLGTFAYFDQASGQGATVAVVP